MPALSLSTDHELLHRACSCDTLEGMVGVVGGASPTIALVTQDAATSRAALRSWVKHHGAGPQPPVLGYSTFLSTLAEHVLPGHPAVLTSRDAAFLLRMAVRSRNARIPERDLTVQMLLRWKADGITPETLGDAVLQDEPEERPRSRRTMQLTSDIWAVYEELKGERFDRIDLVHAMTQAIHTADAVSPVRVLHEWDVRTWAFTGMHRLSDAEWQMIEALAAAGHDCGIRWSSTQTELGTLYRGIRPVDLFTADWTYEELPEPDASRVWLTADDDPRTGAAVLRTRHDEVRGVIESVKRLVRSGVALRDICIAVPGHDSYTVMIEELATRAGIPVLRADRRPLSSLTVVGAVMSMVDVIAHQWRRTDLERVSMSGWVANGPLTAAQWHAMMQTARTIRLTGGSGPLEWRQAFEQRVQQRQQVLASVADVDGDHRDLQRELAQAREALHAVRTLEQALPSVQGDVPASVLSDLVRAVVDAFGIRHPAVDVVLIAIAEYATITEHIGAGAVPLAHHLLECEAYLKDTAWREPDVRLDGVAVLSPLSMRGRTWPWVFAVGCIEDEVPRVGRGGIYEHILPDDALGLAMEAMLDVQRAVAPGGTLVCSHATVDDKRDLMRSSLVWNMLADHPQVDPIEEFGVDPFDPERRPMLTLDEVVVMSIAPTDHYGVRQQLMIETDVTKRLSAGQIDTYTKCPFRYHAQYGLRLRSEEQDEDSLTPLELGAVVHLVTQRFLERVAADNGGRADLTFGDPTRQRTQLFTVAEEVLTSISQQHTYAEVERRVLFGDGVVPGALERWLERERTLMATTGYRPVQFEQRIEPTITHNGVTFTIAGRVDRVDEDLHDPTRRRVVDYKTGSGMPSAADVYRARASQMPLYLTATGAQHAVYMNIESRLYLAKSSQSKRMLKVFGEAEGKKATPPSLESVMDLLAEIVAQIQAGDVSVRPSGTACQNCSFTELCRIDDWGAAPSPQDQP